MLNFNTIKIIAQALIAAAVFQSCSKIDGEGPVVTETRTTGNFSAISMDISGELYYTEGAVYKVEIKAQQNILNEIDVLVSGGTLKIKTKKNNVHLKPDEVIVVNVTAPAVNGLSVGGSGNIHAENAFQPASLSLNISGSGGIQLKNVVTPSVDATISGSGNIFIAAGDIAAQTLRISGSGSIDLLGVTGKTASADVSGSGNIKVFASQTLQAKISGSGNVYYKGTPAVTSQVSGSGSVVHL